MTERQISSILAPAALALLVAVGLLAPLHAEAQRKPRGETSGTKVEVRVAQPKGSASSQPKSTASSQPERRAVPRTGSEQAQRRPRSEARRAPRPGGDGVVRGGDLFPFHHGRYRWYPWGWWGGGWYPYGAYYPWGMGAYWYPEQVRSSMGALDLDIKPEKAKVYLDGQLIGVADNFDGWPRYLWLEQGTYDLVFYHEGYETISRQYSIYPGLVIDVNDRMERGEAVLPEDRLAEAAARRQELLRERIERGGEYGDPGGETVEPREQGEAPGEPDWRERVRSEREKVAAEEPAYDARIEPARLHLRVEPADAAVYLDGRFLGTGAELGDVHAGLIVDPGEHELQVTRPGYAPKTSTFEAEPGQEVELTVELEKNE